MIAGGSTGPAVVPGNPKESLLVDAINYGDTYQMPPKSKLPAEEIATLTEWVKQRRTLGCRDASRHGDPASRPRREIRTQLSKEEFKRARSILELSADQASSRPPSESPAASTGRATRSIASSWRRSQSTGCRRRPRPTGGH